MSEVTTSRPTAPGPSRRDVLKGCAALALASRLPACGEAPLPVRPVASGPHLVVVLADGHRACDTGVAGNDQAATPRLDAFAAQGVEVVGAVSTTPQCRPFRASFMSGCYAARTSVHSNLLRGTPDRKGRTSALNDAVSDGGRWDPGGLPLLGEHFAAAGYRCHYVGKWDLGPPDLRGTERLGFRDGWAAWATNKHEYFETVWCRGPRRRLRADGRFAPAVEVDLALEMLAEDDPRPAFVVLSWGPPHSPLTPPPGYAERFAGVRSRGNVAPDFAQQQERRALPNYYGLLAAVDDQLGRLLDGIDALNRADDTIVVYTSDHGMMLGSHGEMGKELPWSESTAVPLMVRGPGVAGGRRLEQPLGTPDLFPTLAGLCGLESPSGAQGRDLSAVLRGEAGAVGPDEAYLGAAEPSQVPCPGWRGLRTRTHLYARTVDGPWLLYDLAADPLEQNNLVDEQPSLVAELDGRTLALMDAIGDDWRTG